MECPVCYEEYSDERPAKTPGGECRHSACKDCWKAIGERDGPVRCSECRRDVTDWFMDEIAEVVPLANIWTEWMPRELANTAANGIQIQMPDVPLSLSGPETPPEAHRVRELHRSYMTLARRAIRKMQDLAADQAGRGERHEVEWTRHFARQAFAAAEDVTAGVNTAEDATRYLERSQNPLLRMMLPQLYDSTADALLTAIALMEDRIHEDDESEMDDDMDDGESEL